MRPALLLLSLALVACADGLTEAPLPESASFTVVLDSLRRDDPAREVRVAIGVPQIQRKAGTPRAPLLQAVNAAMRDTVRALTDDLRPEAPPRGADPTAVSVTGGPTRMWLTDDGFSTLIEIAVSVGDAPEVVVFLPLTVDLRSGETVAPADLFAPDMPWADTLAAQVGRGVTRQLRGQSPVDPAGLDDLRTGRLALTLGPNIVTVHVAPYQLSPAPAGFHVDVPLAAVTAFARPDGLLARLGASAGDQRAARSPDRTVGAD